MKIVAQLTPVAVEDPGDLKSLSVRIESGATHMWLKPEDIVALVGDLAQNPEWNEAFAGMITYATSKGWTNDAGEVRAHIEAEDQ